jgi:hypothetical protein
MDPNKSEDFPITITISIKSIISPHRLNGNLVDFNSEIERKHQNHHILSVLLQFLVSVIICVSELDLTLTDHMEEHHHLRLKAAEYDICLVWSVLSDLKKAKGYLQISGNLFVD